MLAGGNGGAEIRIGEIALLNRAAQVFAAESRILSENEIRSPRGARGITEEA